MTRNLSSGGASALPTTGQPSAVIFDLRAEREARQPRPSVAGKLPRRSPEFLLLLALYDALFKNKEGVRLFNDACQTLERTLTAHPGDPDAEAALAMVDVLRGKARV